MSRSNSTKRKHGSAREEDDKRNGRRRFDAVRSCVSGKRGYRSRSMAKKALKAANRARFGGAKLETAVYACPDCGDWHLTSKPQR